MTINEIISKLNERELSELRLDYSREGKFVKVSLLQQFKVKGRTCFVVEDEHFKESYERRVQPLQDKLRITKEHLEKAVANYLKPKINESRSKHALIYKYSLVISNPKPGKRYFGKLEVGVQATVDYLRIQNRENKSKLPAENTYLASYENSKCIGIETVVVSLSNQQGQNATLFKRNSERQGNFFRKIVDTGEITLTDEEYDEILSIIDKTNHSTVR